MDPASPGTGQIMERSGRLGQRLLTIAENRLELLLVELQEEKERLLLALLLALGAMVFALLAVLTLTATIVVLCWNYSPAGVLIALTCLYGGSGFCLYRRLTRLLAGWHTLSASLDQLRKDRACLEKLIT